MLVTKKYNKALFDDFWFLGCKMHSESRFAKFKLDKEKVEHLLENAYCCIAYKDNNPVGFMIGVVQPMWFSQELAGYELVLYVSSEHRGSAIAKNLVLDFEEYCLNLGAKDVCVGSSAEISTETARKFYSGIGYLECGFVAHKEI